MSPEVGLVEIAETKSDTDIERYLEVLRPLSHAFDETLYVIDFKRKCFRFVSNKGIFLLGYKSDEVMKLNYNFYREVVNKKDYPFFEKAIQVVEEYFLYPKTSIEDLTYIVFDFRIKGYKNKVMLSHKFMPLIVNNQAIMAICSVSRSASKTPGNLYAYYNSEKKVCYQYSFEGERWDTVPMIKISHTELDILSVIKHGIKGKDASDILGIEHQHMRNILTPLFERLDVDNTVQALIILQNHRVNVEADNKKKSKAESKINKPRKKMTLDKLPRIQARLNNGESYRSIASKEDISVFTIWYAIDKGKLKKKHDRV